MLGKFDPRLKGEVRERRTGTFRLLKHDGAELTIDQDQGIFLSLLLSDTTGSIRSGRFSRTRGRSGEFSIMVPGTPTHLAIEGECRVVQAWLPFGRLSRCWAEDHDMSQRYGLGAPGLRGTIRL